MGVLLFIVILSVLIFVHEFGHFFVARRAGVAVEEFGFGFPPRLWGIQRGPTTYSLNWIPFGGFVRLQGEQGEGDARPDSFVNHAASRQFMIIAAGVVMNLLLAWVLMSSVLTIGVASEQSMVPHDRFARYAKTYQQVLVSPASPTAKAGVADGDHLLTINGQHFSTTTELITYVQQQHYPALDIRFLHAGATREVAISPTSVNGQPRYGLGVETIGQVRYPWYVASWYGLNLSIRLGWQTLQGLGQVVVSFVRTGQVSADVTGPVGIAVLTSQISQLGMVAILQFIALLSISLAVVNFLPIPALDGGRALFILLGRLRGRPINRQVENIIHVAGFYLLLALVILISIRDVRRFGLFQQLVHLWK